MAELKLVQDQKLALEKELKKELLPQSVYKQFQEQGALIDSLSDYLKHKATQEAIEANEKQIQFL